MDFEQLAPETSIYEMPKCVDTRLRFIRVSHSKKNALNQCLIPSSFVIYKIPDIFEPDTCM